MCVVAKFSVGQFCLRFEEKAVCRGIEMHLPLVCGNLGHFISVAFDDLAGMPSGPGMTCLSDNRDMLILFAPWSCEKYKYLSSNTVLRRQVVGLSDR